MKNLMALAALAALVILASAGPAQAQYRDREPDWLAINVNQIQSIVPDVLADYDRRNCESSFIYGTYSTACGRYERQRMLGYGERFAYPDYGYNGSYFGNSGYSFGSGWGYRDNYRRRGRHGDVGNRAVRNSIIIGESVNAGIGIVGLIADHKRGNNEQRLQREANAIQAAQLEELRRLNSGDRDSQPEPTPQGVSGTPVLNRTGCDLVLRQADGSLTAVNAGGMVIVANHRGLQAQVLGNGACQVTGSRTADGGTVILTCQ